MLHYIKKIFYIAPFFLATSFADQLNDGSIEPEKSTLVFLTWEDYIDEELIDEFEKKHHAKIEFVYFEHDEERDDMVASPDGRVFDVIMVDGQSMATYRRLNWLASVTSTHVPNIINYNDMWRKFRPEAVGFGVPYAWGTAGIAYRKDLVSFPVDSLAVLFDPPADLQHKIIMTPQILEMIPAALSLLGVNPNSTDDINLKRAEKMLLAQRPYVQSYNALQLDESSALVTGRAFIAYAYSGDALILQDFNDNIEYVVPKEGSPLWVDFLAVSSKSYQKELALKFLNFMSDNDVIAKNIATTYSASFNDIANMKSPKEIRENPIIFHRDTSQLYFLSEPKPNAVRKMTATLQLLNTNGDY